MLNPATLTLFSASAGSGKTHQLVQTYLYLCLQSERPNAYFDILAITFTRKATAEMKERIVASLQAWVSGTPHGASHQMKEDLIEALKISPEEFQKRAERALQHLLHHYGYFSVTTIDALTHRIVRSFSQDLQLPAAFELEMDRNLLVAEAVDRTLDAYDSRSDLSQFLLQYASYLNEEEEKSWYVRSKLLEQANKLLSGTALGDIQMLKALGLEECRALMEVFKEKNQSLREQIQTIAQKALTRIAEEGIEAGEFSRSSIPNYFKNASSAFQPSDFKRYSPTVQDQLEGNESAYPKSKVKDSSKQHRIEALVPELKNMAYAIDALHQQWFYHFHIRQQLFNIALLGHIQQELDAILEERNLLLMDQLGTFIEEELRHQPSAYLFERMGERYQQLFIDEFQDTSQQQWNNLQPFVEDMMGSGGQVLLVGDAKQAIYRWRGGDVAQFMKLFHQGLQKTPGHELKQLEENWRSLPEVVNFNNGFFTHCAKILAEDPLHAELYTHAFQEPKKKGEGGLVEVRRPEVEVKNNKEFSTWQSQELIALLQELIEEKKYLPKDIALLYRNRHSATKLIPQLQEAGFQVASEQGEEMESCAEVCFLIDMLRLFIDPQDAEAQRQLLYFLLRFHHVDDTQAFAIGKGFTALRTWTTLQQFFPELETPQLPLGTYELLQHWIRVFALNGEADAFLWRLLSESLNKGAKPSTDPIDLVRWWEERGHAITVEQPTRDEALRLMTLHKSKGLQFPVVVMVDCIWKTSSLTENFLWVDLDADEFAGLNRFPFAAKKWEHVEGTLGDAWKVASQNTKLDHINLLYVGFTRAEERLYVFTKFASSTEGGFIHNVLGHFLESEGRDAPLERWGLDAELSSRAQAALQKKIATEIAGEEVQPLHMRSSNWQAHLKIAVTPMFNEEQAFGNRFHEAAVRCETPEDWQALALSQNELSTPVQRLLEQIQQPEYALFFQGWESLNERSLTDPSGQILRPDRVVIDPQGHLHLLDYKTGEARPEHQAQLARYQQAFEMAGFTVGSSRLLYI